MIRNHPTLKDVAGKAGVSTATVSRVISGSGTVAPGTLTAVKAAMAEMRFRPNSIGRMLRQNKTRTIGVLAPSLLNPVFAASIGGIQEVARARGYNVVLVTSDYDSRQELDSVDAMLSHKVEGMILTVNDAERSRALELLDEEDHPYVLLFNQPIRTDRIAVTVDNVAATRCMVQTLIDAGHVRIMMLAGAFSFSDRSIRRYNGYVMAMQDAHLEPFSPLEVDFSGHDLKERLAEILKEKNPTALFCSNDMLALAAIRLLPELGLSVPKDMSICGFDGIEVGEIVRPSLATVVQPATEMGRQAATFLFDRLLEKGCCPNLTFMPYFIRFGESIGSADPSN
jgi:DNA-binding LacI/PurR family transcriptional regulator